MMLISSMEFKDFSERVAYAASRVGGQTALAKAASQLAGRTVSQSAINILINGQPGRPSKPKSSGFTPFLAQAAGLSMEWLATGKGEKEANKVNLPERKNEPGLMVPPASGSFLKKLNTVYQYAETLVHEYDQLPPDYKELVDDALEQQAKLRSLFDAARQKK